jgi:putative superfamily III holin-X/uncharacterized protein DUF3618
MQSTLPRKHDGITPNDLPESKTEIRLPHEEAAASSGDARHMRNRLGRASVFRLARDLVDESKTLIRQEVALARKEIAEKLSYVGRNTAGLGAGLGIAYAGIIVLLIGFGFLIAWAIHLAGIQGLLAAFLGLAGVGLITGMVGGSLILKGVSALKAESLAPERTLRTLQELKGDGAAEKIKAAAVPELPQPSSAEMQSRVEATENHIGETLEALRERLSPRNINDRIKHRIQGHPYRSSLVAMGAGLVGGLVIRRRFRRA